MVTKSDWINALPNYSRGQGYFRTKDNKFCPLGVLADLLVKEGNVPGLKWEEAGDNYNLVSSEGSHPYEWPVSLRLLTNVSIEAYHLARFNDSTDFSSPRFNHLKPWEDVAKWMESVRVIKHKVGETRTYSIPEFDTKKVLAGATNA